MNFRSFRTAAVFALGMVCLPAISSAQGLGWGFCIPGTDDPFSDDFGVQFLISDLMSVQLGVDGTHTQGGGDTATCWADAITANARGGIGFATGTVGSIQSPIDNFLVLTYGMPMSPGGSWGYATILQGTGTTVAETRFGANEFSTTFTGASDTYCFARTTNDAVRVDCRIDLVADAVRIQWDLLNTDDEALNIGLKFGNWVALLTTNPQAGNLSTGGPLGGITYITAPGIKPLQTERRFTRATDPAGFPSSVSFALSQSVGYGLKVENSPTTATADPSNPNEGLTPADEIVIGSHFFLMGPAGDNPTAFPNIIFQEPISDVRQQDSAFIQTYNPISVGAGQSRRIVQVFRGTWGDSVYGRPYSVACDTPKVINLDRTDSSQFAQNPFTVRVYVDNNRGFATVDQELPLQDVRVTLSLPDGLSVLGAATRTINRIDARDIGFVDFQVQADPTVSGDLTYQVRVEPVPGPVKTVTGVIRAVAQPRLLVRNNANLVTSPWGFSSPTWESILNLTVDNDFQAFAYDPIQKGYVIQTGPARGVGTWLISRQERGFVSLGGSPTAPTDWQPNPDGSGGAPLVRLRSGWNLVGNPYNVAFQLGQIVGSSGADSSGSLTWAGLVQRGYVSGSMAFWDAVTQTYRFIDASTDRVEPQRGYWVFVNTLEDVVLRFPPIFEPFVRSAGEKKAWVQSDKQWRLQLSARNGQAADDQNHIGIATNAESARNLTVYEPPMAPVKGAISLSIEKDVNGTPTRLAQTLSENGARQEFNVKVESRDEGAVTVTWPNLSTIPKNVRVRLVDSVTGDTRDMRKNSGYTFQAEARSIRDFKVQMEPGFTSRAVIGSVVVTRDGRSQTRNAPIIVNYTLAADATTSVRILAANGQEVYAVTRGRNDKAGQNSVTWNLRDSANRAVAPGSYRVEVVAEGDDGERVRKFVPVTVIR